MKPVPALANCPNRVPVLQTQEDVVIDTPGMYHALVINKLAVFTGFISLLAASSVSAATISTLYNTGVDALGTVQTNGIAEIHYTLTGAPGGTTNVRVATAVNGFPIGPWLGDNALSAWIGPDSDSQLNGPVGNYIYQTTFSLAGFDPTSAAIAGQWAMDDGNVAIRLNGVSIGPLTDFAFGAFANFNVSSGFVSGINTLEFEIVNTGGPTGLRVEMAGTADIDRGGAAPEPASFILLGGSLLAVGLFRRVRA
ncbi:MAG: hypothetical protein ABI806_16155 [Candidatus Solibacter sp.]